MMIGRKDVQQTGRRQEPHPCCLCRVKSSKSNGQIGEFHGFSLNASYDSFYQTYKLTIKRQCSYQIEIGKDVLGNLQRISNALTGIEKRLTEAEQKNGESVKSACHSTGGGGKAISERGGTDRKNGTSGRIKFPAEHG